MNSIITRSACMRGGFPIALLSLLFLSSMSSGQDVANPPGAEYRPTTVTSTGKATVYTVPTHVVFWIHRTESAETLDAAIKAVAGHDPAIREAVALKELRPVSIETSTPAIVEVEAETLPTVRVSTELRYSMASFVSADIGQAKFGELCEAMKVVAEETGVLSGPHFVTDQKNAVVQEVVREAAREAHPAGLGAAESMNTMIRSVDAMEVISVTWNEPGEGEVTYPTIAQMSCTAEVRVTYVVE